MIQRTVTVRNEAGLHARPSSALVREAAKFESEFTIEFMGYHVNGKSILGIMTLAAECGAQLTLILDGPDEKQAADHLQALFENKFNLDEP